MISRAADPRRDKKEVPKESSTTLTKKAKGVSCRPPCLFGMDSMLNTPIWTAPDSTRNSGEGLECHTLCILEVVEMVKSDDSFDRWKDGKKDAIGRPAAPIELLVLTSLRYIGRSWTFDDLSEATAISEEVIRVFFYKFNAFGSTVFEVDGLEDKWLEGVQSHWEGEGGLHDACDACRFDLHRLHNPSSANSSGVGNLAFL